jgi:hypothetical protein
MASLLLTAVNGSIGTMYGVEHHNVRILWATGIITASLIYLLVRYWIFEETPDAH